jgi:hypothetical protein
MMVQNKKADELQNAYYEEVKLLFHTLMAHQQYMGPLNLPRPAQAVYDRAIALRESWLAEPFFVEE